MLTTQLRVYGIVQGVGFRPTVSRHAITTGVKGSVSNKGPYVEIFLQGTKSQRDQFVELLTKQPPKRAVILKMDEEEIDLNHQFEQFDIIESQRTKGEIFISPDIAICDECAKELYDPQDRRYLHPFINCTCCGPRLTILDELPYDRERTSMKSFPMCPECAKEYYDPDSRRYDAQPVACHNCGPRVKILDEDIYDRDAITMIRQMIVDGKIVAIKGIGGFHLCCDATNEKAVSLLRQRKNRPQKPFAVMMRNDEAVERECVLFDEAREILTGYQKPIILLESREATTLAPSIAPGNPKVGVMLPYTPLHMLLFDYDDGITMPDSLVMTSANTSGAPIVHNDEEARQELNHLCDAIMTHDRDIRVRCDDSVMDFYSREPYMIRRSRGYAPLPQLISADYKGVVLAVGGELKNTFCIGVNQLLYPSSYIGDLADWRSVEALQATVKRMEHLLEVEPEVIACDLHPGYHSTQVAHDYGLPLVEIQHHYAHILSCMAENDISEPVIGVSFDGTGYGTDGTIWGGEILCADLDGFKRLSHITPFAFVGGDIAAKQGWRVAISMVSDVLSDEETLNVVTKHQIASKVEANVVMKMKSKGLNTIQSTSAGRLFDAVSAILGICRESTHEGEAATSLQFAAL
ncbi:MAG: carbamoyltransferase HypF, partial [Erysipelotrichaceae bacterium]|nr:carbamoyltransferase HypF [Erysipelotrichaceae bacterium]